MDINVKKEHIGNWIAVKEGKIIDWHEDPEKLYYNNLDKIKGDWDIIYVPKENKPILE